MNKFPRGFLWGTATASHQVEGGNTNNWSEWEEKNAQRLACEFPKGFSFVEPESSTYIIGKDPRNYTSGLAVDQYHLFKKDISLMKDLNLNAYRFSIEWSRIQPKKGIVDKKEIAHYQEVVEELIKNGIEPVVTLWHWTNPLWVEAEGGVLGKNFGKYFEEYTGIMAKYLPSVKYWITINEPEVIALNSYFWGDWPPNKKSKLIAFKALRLFRKYHKIGYLALKKVLPESKVSFAHHHVYFDLKSKKIGGIITKAVLQYLNEFVLLWVYKKYLDFIAVNQYFRNTVKSWGICYEYDDRIISDSGWEVYPKALYLSLIELNRFGLPIMVSESGIADMNDNLRPWFLKESVKYLNDALNDGVNLIGYLHWSFVDNFEWDKGYWPKFGLIEVNRETMERIPRQSAFLYSEIAKNNGALE